LSLRSYLRSIGQTTHRELPQRKTKCEKSNAITSANPVHVLPGGGQPVKVGNRLVSGVAGETLRCCAVP